MNKIDQSVGLSTDQQLELVEIKALPSIAQELSRIHHEGINPNTVPTSTGPRQGDTPS